MMYTCVDCGYETNDRWLMCPECTTDEDWAEVRREVEQHQAALIDAELQRVSRETGPI